GDVHGNQEVFEADVWIDPSAEEIPKDAANGHGDEESEDGFFGEIEGTADRNNVEGECRAEEAVIGKTEVIEPEDGRPKSLGTGELPCDYHVGIDSPRRPF